MKRILIPSLVTLLATTAVHALVLANDPTGNTSAPTGINGQPTDPGFANIGSVNGSSGVYLGNGWVLTANHVRAGDFTTGAGTTYQYQAGTAHRIANTDLVLFKLTASPTELAALTIATNSPGVGEEVVMIGAGLSASTSNPIQYYVDTTNVNDKGEPNWIWSTSNFSGANEIHQGYLTNSTKTIRWGTNTVYGHGNHSSIGAFYATSFDMEGGTAYEAQAVRDDSGGGVFFYDGEGWYLSGIMVSVEIYSNQPNSAGSAFDGNKTFIVDLSKYAAEINAIIVPEPTTYALLLGLVASALIVRRYRRSNKV